MLSLNGFQLIDRKWFLILDIPAHFWVSYFSNGANLHTCVCTQVRSLNSVFSSRIDTSKLHVTAKGRGSTVYFLSWYLVLHFVITFL